MQQGLCKVPIDQITFTHDQFFITLRNIFIYFYFLHVFDIFYIHCLRSLKFLQVLNYYFNIMLQVNKVEEILQILKMINH